MQYLTFQIIIKIVYLIKNTQKWEINMKYSNYLKSKNLSKNTISIYLREYEKWQTYLNGKKPNKTMFVKYLNKYSKNHQANSTRLIYASILSIFRFEKRWTLLNQCKDIKLAIEVL